MRPAHVHVVGAGLAGLAAALSLVEAGVSVTLHEAGPAAGGRCRSYFDRELGCRIDNGNHLLLSGNRAAFAYLAQIGSQASLAGPATALFPFVDVTTGERWTVRPSRGRLPFWIFDRRRRVPGTGAADYLQLLRLRLAGPDATVGQTLRPGALYRRLLEPLTISALNTMPAEGSARLLAAVVNESLAEGGAACLPRYPRDGLSETFIDPALAWLRARGTEIRFSSRVGAIDTGPGRAVRLDGVALGDRDAIVLATPASVAATLLPGLVVPDAFEAILNLHFRAEAPPHETGFVGLIGGLAEWVFIKPGVISVTISAANRYAALDLVAVVQQVWQEVCVAVQRDQPRPSYRMVRERRATFVATPAQDRRRPSARTALANVVLAGDWTATGLPATIEGAIRSGRRAADTLLSPAR